MQHSEHDDGNLAEVKAILGRLQRISRKSRAGGAQTAGIDAGSPSLPSGEAEGAGAVVARFSLPVKAAAVAAPLLAFVVGVVIVATGRRPDAVVKEPPPDSASQNTVAESAPTQAAPKSQDISKPQDDLTFKKSPALQTASNLMASGQVRAARATLLRAMQGDSADVAWALARSYDPNYLATIASADAGPDVAEATRWYRTWYGIAVKQGLVSDSVSLERIIRAME